MISREIFKARVRSTQIQGIPSRNLNLQRFKYGDFIKYLTS